MQSVDRVLYRISMVALVAGIAAACGEPVGPASTQADAGAADAGVPSDAAARCNSTTGLSAPTPVCSATNPCTRPSEELPREPITESSEVPFCRTLDLSSSCAGTSARPAYDDGPPQVSSDSQGTTRYACRYAPPGASAQSKRPLIIWLHGGGGGGADDLYNLTSIRTKAIDYDLLGDGARLGFHLISVQGRNLQYPTVTDRDGAHHDFYYRDLASPSRNPDVAYVDQLIDDAVASQTVDADHIYLMGWSNGGFFSQMYGIARHSTPTPGGNRVAAVVAYTAGDPFHNITEGQTPSCQLDPYPQSALPIFLISRACDIVACSREQFASQAQPNPGHWVGPWRDDLVSKVGDSNVEWRIVTGLGSVTDSCTSVAACTPSIAVLNHVRWPDGICDRSGNDHEPAMLDFLAAHSLR